MAESSTITNSIRIADKATHAFASRNAAGDVRVEFKSRLQGTKLSTLEIPAALVPQFAALFANAAPEAQWKPIGTVKNV